MNAVRLLESHEELGGVASPAPQKTSQLIHRHRHCLEDGFQRFGLGLRELLGAKLPLTPLLMGDHGDPTHALRAKMGACEPSQRCNQCSVW